jgi:hypothetical protein
MDAKPALNRRNSSALVFGGVNIGITFGKHNEDVTLSENRDRITERATLVASDGGGCEDLPPPCAIPVDTGCRASLRRTIGQRTIVVASVTTCLA